MWPFKKKLKIVVKEPDRWPERNNVLEWMIQKVEYARQTYPEDAYNLFYAHSAGYLPLLIAIGTTWNEENKKLYLQVRNANMDLVSQAQERKSLGGIETLVSISRVGYSEDY